MAKEHAYVVVCLEQAEIIAKKQKVGKMLSIQYFRAILDLSFFTYLSVQNIIRPTDAPCQCQDDREDSNGGGNCEKPLVGVGRNSGKDYCYVTLPSGCKDLEDSPVEGQDGQKISAEACNSGLSTAS